MIARVVHPERAALVALEHYRIITHVVTEKDREHDDVWRIGPHLALQSDQFLRGTVTIDAEVHSLDSLALQQRTICQFASRDRGEGLVLGDLNRFGIRVADNRYANYAGRFDFRIIGSAKTVAIDANVGFALAFVMSMSAGVEPPTPVLIVAIEVGEPVVRDADADVGDSQREAKAEGDQYECANQLSHR